MKPHSAVETFNAEPTPQNAIALAVADHRAGKLTDWPFIDALNKAKAQLDSRQRLIDALAKFAEVDEKANAEIIAGNGGGARHLLMVYRQEVAKLLKEVS